MGMASLVVHPTPSRCDDPGSHGLVVQTQVRQEEDKRGVEQGWVTLRIPCPLDLFRSSDGSQQEKRRDKDEVLVQWLKRET